MADVTLIQNETYDLDIWGGKSFSIDVQFTEVADDGTETPVPIAEGDQVIGQIAKSAGGAVLATFGTTIVDAPSGKFRIELTPEQTRKVSDRAVYEVAIANGSNVIGLWAGRIKYRRGIIA